MSSTQFILSFVLCVVVLAVPGQWTTGTPLPSYPDYGIAIGSGGHVLSVVSSETYLFDTATGTWTTLASRPTNQQRSMGAALAGGKAIIAGGSPLIMATHVFDFATLGWTSKVPMPANKYRAASGSDGVRFWISSGLSSDAFEYNSVADGWTQRLPCPLACDNSAGAYAEGSLVVACPSMEINVYTVADDVWTTGSSFPSVSVLVLYDAVDAINGYVYLAGPYHASYSLLQFTVQLDSWTTLESLPVLTGGSAMAITPSGLLFTIGHHPGNPRVHVFDTGLTASVTGDPVVLAFTGDRHHLDLFPGVFNLLTTTDLVVNAVVDVLPSLPLEENTVMTMIGIVAKLPSGVLLHVDCGSNQGDFVCHSKQIVDGSAQNVSAQNLIALDTFGLAVYLPSYRINVRFQRTSMCIIDSADGVTPYGLSSWFDVAVTSLAPLPPCTGLLCVSASTALDLDYFEVHSGCLMDTNSAVPA